MSASYIVDDRTETNQQIRRIMPRRINRLLFQYRAKPVYSMPGIEVKKDRRHGEERRA